MNFYPVQLHLRGRQVVVIGGGKVAERKISGLLGTGSEIAVISPDITEKIKEWMRMGRVKWLNKAFAPTDIAQAFLIIAATNNPDTNAAVKRASSPHQLLLMVDNPEDSDFILPSVINRGKLTMTVSTSGASPILAKNIKRDLANQYGPEYKDYVDFLFECRKWILQEIHDPSFKRLLLSKITEPLFLNSSNRKEEFQQLVNRLREKNK